MKYNFICDCQECVDNSFKFYLPRTPFPTMFMNRKDFSKTRDFMIEWWYKLNTSKNEKEIITRECQVVEVMRLLAYYATFPCSLN